MNLGRGAGLGAWAEAGMHDGVSRSSLCSRAQRPTGTGSSAKMERRRSVRAARAVGPVAALGVAGTKKTLAKSGQWSSGGTRLEM